MVSIPIRSETEVNAVVVLQSLTPEEPRTGANLFRTTIRPICERDGQACEFHEPGSPAEVFTILDRIERNCTERGWMPIVHFETHGDDLDGLKIEPAGEYVSWDELGHHLRAINRACANRAVVVVAACYGMHALSTIGDIEAIDNVAPFFALIGPDDEITAPRLEEAMTHVYSRFLNGSSITEAVAARKPPLIDFLSESLLLNSALRHLWRRCMGEGLQRRIEKVVGVEIAYALIEGGKPENTADLLRQAREVLRAENFDLEKYKRRFLMADDPRNAGRFTTGVPDLLAALRHGVPSESARPD